MMGDAAAATGGDRTSSPRRAAGHRRGETMNWADAAALRARVKIELSGGELLDGAIVFLNVALCVGTALCVAARLNTDDGGGDDAVWHRAAAPRSEWLPELKVRKPRHRSMAR